MAIHEESLLVLLGAKSKEIVDDVFMTCFRYRHDGVPKRVRPSISLCLRTITRSITPYVVMSTPSLCFIIVENQRMVNGTRVPY
jgi:hypothetical protein